MAFDRVFIMSINIDIELCIDHCIYFLSLMWASVANNLSEKKKKNVWFSLTISQNQ